MGALERGEDQQPELTGAVSSLCHQFLFVFSSQKAFFPSLDPFMDPTLIQKSEHSPTRIPKMG